MLLARDSRRRGSVGHSNEETCGETPGHFRGGCVICVAVVHTKRQQSIQNDARIDANRPLFFEVSSSRVGVSVYVCAFTADEDINYYLSPFSRHFPSGLNQSTLGTSWKRRSRVVGGLRAVRTARLFRSLAFPRFRLFSLGESSGSRARQRRARGSLTIERKLVTGEDERAESCSRLEWRAPYEGDRRCAEVRDTFSTYSCMVVVADGFSISVLIVPPSGVRRAASIAAASSSSLNSSEASSGIVVMSSIGGRSFPFSSR